MRNYAVYNLKTGVILKTISIPERYKESIPIEDGQSIVEIPRVADDTKEYIKDGELTSIN